MRYFHFLLLFVLAVSPIYAGQQQQQQEQLEQAPVEAKQLQIATNENDTNIGHAKKTHFNNTKLLQYTDEPTTVRTTATAATTTTPPTVQMHTNEVRLSAAQWDHVTTTTAANTNTTTPNTLYAFITVDSALSPAMNNVDMQMAYETTRPIINATEHVTATTTTTTKTTAKYDNSNSIDSIARAESKHGKTNESVNAMINANSETMAKNNATTLSKAVSVDDESVPFIARAKKNIQDFKLENITKLSEADAQQRRTSIGNGKQRTSQIIQINAIGNVSVKATQQEEEIFLKSDTQTTAAPTSIPVVDEDEHEATTTIFAELTMPTTRINTNSHVSMNSMPTTAATTTTLTATVRSSNMPLITRAFNAHNYTNEVSAKEIGKLKSTQSEVFGKNKLQSLTIVKPTMPTTTAANTKTATATMSTIQGMKLNTTPATTTPPAISSSTVYNNNNNNKNDDITFEHTKTDNNNETTLTTETTKFTVPLPNTIHPNITHTAVTAPPTSMFMLTTPNDSVLKQHAVVTPAIFLATSTSTLRGQSAIINSNTRNISTLAASSSYLSALTAATPSTTSAAAWPVKHASVVEGDVILGGLMMVHSREDTITCGPIMPQGGIQALEAMLYTLDQVNAQQLLPNITLGAHILDDCDKDTYGLEMAVDFIKGSISNIDDAEYHCNKTQVRKVISGVVGAASSVTSIQVANLLRLFRIPQVSFFSTSPELSNKQRFEYFSRTIPSDHYQVKAMVEIVKRMGWSYVSIIYEESNYGIKAFEELEELLARHNICIAIKEKLVKDSGVAEEIAYDNIVQKLLTKSRARGAIIFGSDQEVREVMRAVRRNNATGAFSWIGSDGWSARNLVSDGNEPEVEGTLSVQPQANPVRGFEQYFLNLTVENNQRNPWFVEFWEDHFQCRYPGSLSTPYNNYSRTCTTKERLSRENTDFEDQLQFVSDAVMAFAYALRDMHQDLCEGRPSLCDDMKPTKGADLLKYLRKVQFQGLSGDHFRFDNNGDGPARYNIIHFKQSVEGQYHWVKVGEYYEGELRLNMSEVQFKLLDPKPPESVCSLPCERGQAKKYVEGESCCWHCFNCSTYQIRHRMDETQCFTCQLGTLPDASKEMCRAIPEVYLRPESAWAIGAMAFSATGILVTLFVVGVFVRHNDTPIVRASGRELSYILLAGILMCYAVTFALVLKPTNIVCAIQRFSVGFCFTVVYAALLTKTNRIARIFKAGKQSAKRPSFISPKSQLVICSFFIFVQILINGVWMVIAPSHAMYHYPTREDNLLVCDSYIDASYMIAFFYPIVLIVICTVYAVLTRKIPEAFNESKHIGFTMYTTCVIWLAFVPLYFGTANHVPLRITSMSVTISLSASVTIVCLFSPKLYIILVRPERNVRQSMMPPRYGNMHRTAGTGPSSMMAAAVVTAATCAQEEKLQKHITPTSTEHSTKAKKLCEIATQTISITNIFTNLDSSTYSQIPYADQYVPNNTHHQQHQLHQLQHQQQSADLCHTNAETQHDAQQDHVVATNNKINQHQHGNVSTTAATATMSPAATATATTTNTNTNTAMNAINGVTTTTTLALSPTASTTPLSNHIMLQQHLATQCCTATTTTRTKIDEQKSIECQKPQTTATTSL